MSELTDYAEARRIIQAADPKFLEAIDMGRRRHRPMEKVAVGGRSFGDRHSSMSATHATDPEAAAQVFTKAKRVLREQWAEFMLVDLKGFAQRWRLRAIIFRTFRRTTDVSRSGALTHRSPVWLECMANFLRLVRDLMKVHFFNCLYDEYPRCRLPVKGRSEYPYFYSKTKSMRFSVASSDGPKTEKKDKPSAKPPNSPADVTGSVAKAPARRRHSAGGDGAKVLSSVLLQPFTVLGTSADRSLPESAEEHDSCCVVDTASLRRLQANAPAAATGASKPVYDWCGLSEMSEFPPSVTLAVRGPGDAKLHAYVRRSDTGVRRRREMHVVHALGPELHGQVKEVVGAGTRLRHMSRAEAVAALAHAYHNIFVEFVASGRAVLRLVPVNSGESKHAGPFREELPALTVDAVKAAFEMLTSARQAAVMASTIDLCVPNQQVFGAYVAAGFSPAAAAGSSPKTLQEHGADTEEAGKLRRASVGPKALAASQRSFREATSSVAKLFRIVPYGILGERLDKDGKIVEFPGAAPSVLRCEDRKLTTRQSQLQQAYTLPFLVSFPFRLPFHRRRLPAFAWLTRQVSAACSGLVPRRPTAPSIGGYVLTRRPLFQQMSWTRSEKSATPSN